jgi:butyrate kinase
MEKYTLSYIVDPVDFDTMDRTSQKEGLAPAGRESAAFP